MIYVPKRNIETVLSVPLQKALYDFNASAKIDFSGNGFTLSRTAPPLLDLGLPPNRTGKRLTGTTDDIDTIGTSLIGDSDHFYVWAWVYVKKLSGSTQIFGRGKDGSGTGWSVGFWTDNGAVVTSIVLVNPSTLQWSATSSNALKLGWNFVAILVQNTFGAEPSHISAICETSQTRTGLTGHTQLRSSTVGSFVGAGASQGLTRSDNPIGAVGIRVINGYTEAQALAELKLIRSITEPQFRSPEKQTFLFKSTTSGPTYTLTAATGSFTLTGVSATLKVSRKLVAATGTYSLTGQAAAFNVSRKLVAATGTYTLSGIAANLVYTPVSGATYTLTAQTGTFSLTGQAAAFKVSRKLVAEVVAYTLIGKDVGLYLNGVVPVTTKGGAGRGKNLTLKQKKKLKAVVNQEWLKAEQTVQELLLERLGQTEPAKVRVGKLTQSQSLLDVIEALKALSKETVTLPEQQAVIKTLNKTITEKTIKQVDRTVEIEKRMAEFEKRLVDIEEMVLVALSEIL